MARMFLCMCNCQDAEYRRIKRPLWAKLIWPERRMFRCSSCDTLLLVQAMEVIEAKFKQRLERFPFLDRAFASPATLAPQPGDMETPGIHPHDEPERGRLTRAPVRILLDLADLGRYRLLTEAVTLSPPKIAARAPLRG